MHAAKGPVPAAGRVLIGQGHNGDFTVDAPGVRHLIRVRDMPAPYATRSVDHGPDVIRRPEGAWPKAPPEFKVTLYATGIRNPRLIRVAPNGDAFVADSYGGRVLVFRGVRPDGRAAVSETFASGLQLPFGINFYPPGPNPRYVYVGETGAVVRFPYRNGDLHARGPAEHLADIPSGGRLRGGGHWTRDVVFSRDGHRMFVSVGSRTNDMETYVPSLDEHRATVLEFTPDGKNERDYASGIRNAVGIEINPVNGELWGSVNERDGLGDDLVPDYVTRIEPGGFYGWPWYYIGSHHDPRHRGAHPELNGRVAVPDVLLQSHMASLEMCFYTGSQFPAEYRNDAFAAQHGSWNRRVRTGYKIVRIPQKNGVPTGEYVDFITGFVMPDGRVWGRPVGVATAMDGALLFTDDGTGSIWRVTYTGNRH